MGEHFVCEGSLGWGGRALMAAKFVAVMYIHASFLPSLLIFATNLISGGVRLRRFQNGLEFPACPIRWARP